MAYKAFLLLEGSPVCMNCLFSCKQPQILGLCKGSLEQQVQGVLGRKHRDWIRCTESMVGIR